MATINKELSVASIFHSTLTSNVLFTCDTYLGIGYHFLNLTKQTVTQESLHHNKPVSLYSTTTFLIVFQSRKFNFLYCIPFKS